MSQTITVELPDGTTQEVPWLKSSRSRHIRISWGQKGPRVSSPPFARQSMVENFVRTQSGWLAAQRERHTRLPANSLLYLGRVHRVKVEEHPHPDRVVAVDNHLLVRPVALSAKSVTGQLHRWLKTRASEHATPLILEYGQKMEVDVSTLRFRDTSSRWGSCTAYGAITLNWRLAHTPIPVIRYVVIHELAHRVHLNHSRAFWRLVEQYDPDHLVHRGWLKRHGHLCRTPEIVL